MTENISPFVFGMIIPLQIAFILELLLLLLQWCKLTSDNSLIHILKFLSKCLCIISLIGSAIVLSIVVYSFGIVIYHNIELKHIIGTAVFIIIMICPPY